MTIAKGDPADARTPDAVRGAAPATPARRSHVPNDGTAEAAAVERARTRVSMSSSRTRAA